MYFVKTAKEMSDVFQQLPKFWFKPQKVSNSIKWNAIKIEQNESLLVLHCIINQITILFSPSLFIIIIIVSIKHVFIYHLFNAACKLYNYKTKAKYNYK